MWEPGKLVEVEGTVRVRGDRTNISCQGAAEYDASKTPEEGATGAVEEPAPATEYTNGRSPNGRPEPPVASAPEPPVESAEPPAARQAAEPEPPPAQPGKLIVRLRESGEQEHDQQMLYDVKSLLLDSPGSIENRPGDRGRRQALHHGLGPPSRWTSPTTCSTA